MTQLDWGARWVITVLQCLPTHREPRMSIAQIAERVCNAVDATVTQDAALSATQTAIAMLRAFGVLDENAEGIRAVGQMPAYFQRSLEWYVRNNASMLDGWRDHKSLSQADSNGTRGPHFLREIEKRRLQLAQELGVDATPSREQQAALILLKATVRRRPHFLFQWDARASQFQLIGGRIEPNETPAQAAIREFQEEVGDDQSPCWRYERDYDIAPLPLKGGAITFTHLSPTYGALTAYTFHVFAAHVHAQHIALTAGMRWFNREDMLRGATTDGMSLGEPMLYRALFEKLAGGIRRLPASFALQV